MSPFPIKRFDNIFQVEKSGAPCKARSVRAGALFRKRSISGYFDSANTRNPAWGFSGTFNRSNLISLFRLFL